MTKVISLQKLLLFWQWMCFSLSAAPQMWYFVTVPHDKTFISLFIQSGFLSHVNLAHSSRNPVRKLTQLFSPSFLFPENTTEYFRVAPLTPSLWFIVKIQITSTAETILITVVAPQTQRIPEGRKMGHCIAVVLFP